MTEDAFAKLLRGIQEIAQVDISNIDPDDPVAVLVRRMRAALATYQATKGEEKNG